MRRPIRVAARWTTPAHSCQSRFGPLAPDRKRHLREDGPRGVAKIVGDDAEDVVTRLTARCARAMQARVLDRERRAAGELFSQTEIGLVQMRRRGGESKRAEDRPVRQKRHAR